MRDEPEPDQPRATQTRRGRPGTSSRTTRPEAAAAGQHAARLAQHEQRRRARARTAAPTPGQDLAAFLLRERDAGPEPEQEVARLPVHVAERVAQPAAEEERLDVAVEHAQHDPAGDDDDPERREDQRQPALELRCAPGAGARRASRRRAPSARRSTSAWSADSAQLADSQDQSQRPARPATASSGMSRGLAAVTAAAATRHGGHADRDRPPDGEVVEAVRDRAHARAEAEQGQQPDRHPARELSGQRRLGATATGPGG